MFTRGLRKWERSSLVKLKIESNFSFAKLAKEMPRILEKHSTDMGRGSAKSIKTALEKGSYQPLEASTIDIRKKGGSPSAGFMKTNSKKPLIHTGSLRNSIRVDKKGIKMHHYGKLQNDGFITDPKSMLPNRKVDKNKKGRPFIDRGLAVETPESKQAEKDLSKNIRKALMK